VLGAEEHPRAVGRSAENVVRAAERTSRWTRCRGRDGGRGASVHLWTWRRERGGAEESAHVVGHSTGKRLGDGQAATATAADDGNRGQHRRQELPLRGQGGGGVSDRVSAIEKIPLHGQGRGGGRRRLQR
jgi:hypothetical protein